MSTPAIAASWLSSTGAGDDVLEVTMGGPVEVTMRVNAANLRQIADTQGLEVFGLAAGHVAGALDLYRLAHEPALAHASEDAARAALAERRASNEKLEQARRDGVIR